ncbi:catalase [Alteromonas aestuariivivens]|uniref:catalase n=1 Tax=Alteromonas aestuariivivens TaxID=1938339 RepID=A0A3D8M4D3_9ALTE|nr:catalase [Alteromonas aestuariivivens]RDV24603.1 catalase [Alteromonas aestuariivivens]
MTRLNAIRRLSLPTVLLSTLLCATGALGQQFAGEQFNGQEDALAAQMSSLIKQVVQNRYPTGTLRRFNQAKSLGCFDARFSVNENVPAKLRFGIFSHPANYPAWVRFANASTQDDEDKDLRGMSIRLSGVSGDVAWGQPGYQDFVLNSHPVLFAATPEEFQEFIQAQLDDDMLWYFLNPAHWDSLLILLNARGRPASPFDIRYWSTTPYQLGPNQAVKYSVKPCSDYRSEKPNDYTNNYLRAAMQTHLENAAVCFDFMLQSQTNNRDMPIEDASAEWDEDESPFVPVARLTFGHQPFISTEALDICEQSEFNPWQSLTEHKPLGRMNYVRKQIYQELSAFRMQSRQPNP